MTTHRVNDIVRGKQSRRLALVKEVGNRVMTCEYLEGASSGGMGNKKGDVVQRLHGMFEPVRPDAVGQYARRVDASVVGRVTTVYPPNGPSTAIAVQWDGLLNSYVPTDLVRVAEPEKLDESAPMLYFPSDGDVDRFKRAWEKADREGKYGERVRAGLEASISFVVSEIIAERDRRGRVLEEVRAELGAVQDHAAAARTTDARTIKAKNETIARLDSDLNKANGELAALRPDPDAAAKAAIARFHNYTPEGAERFWRDISEVNRASWRRVAAS